jgi:hypothetical protein|tara:strand:+ start:459 stop:794 length:336 start_codon:yes stop_codon:yes gene_type:complete
MKNILIILTLAYSLVGIAQYEILHINSAWNVKHNLDLKGIKYAKVKYLLLEEQTLSFKQQIKSVPTILVLQNGKPKGQWSGGIALKLTITKEDIEDHIEKLMAQQRLLYKK